MSQDNVADVLNRIMNAKRARRDVVITKRYSKLLLKILDLMKEKGYIDYELTDDSELKIEIKEINECKAVKPRYTFNIKTLDKYIKRFLPSRNFGYVVVSTNKGIMIHSDAIENKVGGCLLAYFY